MTGKLRQVLDRLTKNEGSLLGFERQDIISAEVWSTLPDICSYFCQHFKMHYSKGSSYKTFPLLSSMFAINSALSLFSRILIVFLQLIR